jgi:hypothetical protein
MAVKRWVWIVAGLFGTLFILAVGGIGACAYFVTRHMDMRQVTPAQAEAEFVKVRERFKGQEPLLEIKDDGKVIATRLEQRAGTYTGPLPGMLRIMAWEKGEPNRVSLFLPMWLLRLKGNLDIQNDSIDLERARVKIEDLERAGPALLIDHTDGHRRLLVWTE